MSVIFPDALSLAQLPTPIQCLSRLSKQLGGPTIWVKRDDLTGAATSGNKIRKLEFVLADAQQQGADVLITCGGVQSNHCRATAILAAQLGFKCHLLLRGTAPAQPVGNLYLDQLAGATIEYCTAREYAHHLSEKLQQIAAVYQAQGLKPYIIPTGASNEVGLWGYVKACAEIKTQCAALNFQPDVMLSATGSGGTHAGLIVGNQLFGLNSRVMAVNVCDDKAYFVQKSGQDMRDWQQRYAIDLDTDALPIEIIEGYIGPGYGKATPAIYDCITTMARLEGLILDPVYSGKAFYGLIQEIQQGRFNDVQHVLFIHTGGLFGLLAQPTME